MLALLSLTETSTRGLVTISSKPASNGEQSEATRSWMAKSTAVRWMQQPTCRLVSNSRTWVVICSNEATNMSGLVSQQSARIARC